MRKIPQFGFLLARQVLLHLTDWRTLTRRFFDGIDKIDGMIGNLMRILFIMLSRQKKYVTGIVKWRAKVLSYL